MVALRKWAEVVLMNVDHSIKRDFFLLFFFFFAVALTDFRVVLKEFLRL